MSYDDSNKGAIWKNERKETDSHPDFTGSLNVEGKEYWVSAWKRDPNADNPKAPALKFSVKPKEQRQGSAPQRRAAAPDFNDDDINF